MLIAFLADKEISLDDERYILQCYKLLGQCISSRSLPFLREILLESKMTGMFNNIKNINKSGASYALLMLGTEEAIDILKTGAKSVRSDVRQVCQKALQHMDNLNT